MKANRTTIPRIPNIERRLSEGLTQLKFTLDSSNEIKAPTRQALKRIEGIAKEILHIIEPLITNGTTTKAIPTNCPSSDSISISDAKKNKEYFLTVGKFFYNLRHTYSIKVHTYVSCSTGLAEFDTFIDMYKDWFDARINRRHNTSRGFSPRYYSNEVIVNTLYTFILLYGYHLEFYDMHKFNESIHTWMDDIDTNQYAAEHFLHPHEVGKLHNMLFDNSSSEYDSEVCKYFTETSLILWDLLLQKGFNKIIEEYNKYSDGPQADDFVNLYKIYAPEVLDSYPGITDEQYLLEHEFGKGDDVN